jgi:hypothetical protein
MTDLHPDHLHLLALARRATTSRDDHARWTNAPRQAAELHATACNALWDELERQITIADGAVPVLEHPSATQKRRAAQMRCDIIATVQHAVQGALDDLINGTLNMDDD